MPLIKVNNLVKNYSETRAIDHLNLEIEKGEIFGLLGPNGAGKTTLILTLLGLSEPTAGSVSVKGFDATSNPLQVKKITSYLPDDVGFADNSTAIESLIYTAMLNGIPRKKAAKSALELLETVGLQDVWNHKTKTYSKGMLQRLGLADVLIKDPEIMVLDEPTIGIDPKGINNFLDMIRNLSKDKGITVLLSSHLLHQVQKICDRVGILVDGKLRAQGNINALAHTLFDQKDTSFTAQVTPITDEMIHALLEDKDIHEVKKEEDYLFIKGSREAAPFISETIVHNGGKLYRLSYKEYGLDEIYEHYFEGGLSHV